MHTASGENCQNAGVDGSPPNSGSQRREHVRVDLSRRCAVRMAGHGTVAAELVDLSGTGCAFVMGHSVESGDRGTITISFDDWTLEARIIVRFVKSQPGGFRIGVAFESVLRSEVDRIVREVFTALRLQLRNRRTAGQ